MQGFFNIHKSINVIHIKKFKEIEISVIFSDHNGMKLEISYKKKTVKMTNMWSLNNIHLNNQ